MESWESKQIIQSKGGKGKEKKGWGGWAKVTQPVIGKSSAITSFKNNRGIERSSPTSLGEVRTCNRHDQVLTYSSHQGAAVTYTLTKPMPCITAILKTGSSETLSRRAHECHLTARFTIAAVRVGDLVYLNNAERGLGGKGNINIHEVMTFKSAPLMSYEPVATPPHTPSLLHKLKQWFICIQCGNKRMFYIFIP